MEPEGETRVGEEARTRASVGVRRRKLRRESVMQRGDFGFGSKGGAFGREKGRESGRGGVKVGAGGDMLAWRTSGLVVMTSTTKTQNESEKGEVEIHSLRQIWSNVGGGSEGHSKRAMRPKSPIPSHIQHLNLLPTPIRTLCRPCIPIPSFSASFSLIQQSS